MIPEEQGLEPEAEQRPDRPPSEEGEAPGAPRGRQAVVEALLASARELFAERGIDGASVRQVASAARVNHALVFRHFGSKQQLVRAVLERLLDDLLGELRASGLDPSALAGIGEGVAGRAQLWKLLTRAVLDGEVEFLSGRTFPELEGALATVTRAQAEGRARSDVEPRLLLSIVLAGALGWELLDAILVDTVGTPGATPRRRRELARAAFGELLGTLPPGRATLSPEESARAAVPRQAPVAARRGAPLSPRGGETDPPPRRGQVAQALIDAAMEPFAERGPAAVSVREVAARAGVNHALVFRHFGSKDGLVQAVWERVVEDLAGRVVIAPDEQGLTALGEALAESETVWKLLARAILDGQSATIASYRYPFVDTLVWATARGQEAGLLAGGLHPRLLLAMVIAMGFGWLIFHPVLLPLLGIPMRDARARRDELRGAVATLLGWRGDAAPGSSPS